MQTLGPVDGATAAGPGSPTLLVPSIRCSHTTRCMTRSGRRCCNASSHRPRPGSSETSPAVQLTRQPTQCSRQPTRCSRQLTQSLSAVHCLTPLGRCLQGGRAPTPIPELTRRADAFMGMNSHNRLDQRGAAFLSGVWQRPGAQGTVALKARKLLEVTAAAPARTVSCGLGCAGRQ